MELDAEATEECHLMACPSWISQNAFLYIPGAPTQGLNHSQ